MRRITIAAACLLAAFAVTERPASAAPLALVAEYTISTNHNAGAVTFNEQDTDATVTEPFVQISRHYTNTDVGTYNATAFARAERFLLRSHSGFSFSGFPGNDGVAPFYDSNSVTAKARWAERLTVSGVGDTVYMVPVFRLTGTITNNAFGFASYALTASTTAENKTLAEGSSPVSTTVDVMSTSAAIPLSDGAPVDVEFALATEAFLQGEFPAATVDADFSTTAELIHFVFYADPKLTIQLGRDDLTLTAGDGTDFELLIFPEPGTLALLTLAALPFTRRHRQA